LNGRHRPRTPATSTLMIMILLAFGVEVLSGAWMDPEKLSRGAILPMALLRESGQYWRLLSGMFLHGDGTPVGGLLHVGANLFSLWQLGTLYELMFGRRRFVSIYFVAGLAASITSAMHMPLNGSSVGASGAVFGILGAMISSILTSPRFRRDRRARGLVGQCIFWLLINIAATANMEQIDNAAHFGGLAAGLLLGALLPHRPPPPPAPGSAVVDVRPDE
jgi:membrane associated rhomboid family serine protease